MTRNSRRLSCASGFSLLVAALFVLFSRDARACGLFTPRVNVKAPPRLEHERTLILWDGVARREHFVREVRFGGGGEQPFGFVVPTPSRPEVAGVKTSPFDALEARFAHTLLDVPGSNAPGSVDGKGMAAGAAPRGLGGAPPVQVLEKKRIGDFTSFVLAATDAKALADWLKKNQFTISEAGKQWTARYVDLGFFFVALRYDGKKRKAGESEALSSRTLRISFDTALPYYPYAEPADAPEQSRRELQVWLASSEPLTPLAGVATAAGWEIRHPFSEGARYEASHDDLANVLGADLAPFVPASSSLQTFGDWKHARRGFGDLVLAPAVPQGCDETCASARRPLLALLDPTLRAAAPVSAAELAVPPPAPRPGRSRAGGSASIPVPAPITGGACLLALLAVAGAFRRARRRLAGALALFAPASLVVMYACGGPPPPEAPPPPTPPALASSAAPALTLAVPGDEPPRAKPEPFALSSDPAERQKALMRLLSGQVGEHLIATWSTPLERGIGRARNTLPVGFADPSALERRCLGGEPVEAVVAYTLTTGPDGRAERARVEGPLPDSMLSCIESELASGLRSAPASQGWLSLGSITPEVLELRRAINDAKFVSLPVVVTRVKQNRITVSAGLRKEVVTRILRQQFGRFRMCYERTPQPHPNGTVTLRFSIGPGGDVTAMAAATADVATQTGLCIGDAARQLGFPQPQAGRTVKVTFVLGFGAEP